MRHRVLDRTRRLRPKRVLGVDSTHPPLHTSTMSARDLKRLGESVINRRGELKMTQEEFAQAGGLNVKTVQRVEKGLIEPRAKTLGGLDDAGGWVSGSARALLETGRAPILKDDSLAGLYERVTRNETEEAIMEIEEIPEDNRWAKIFQRRKRIAGEQGSQGSPMGRLA